MENKSFEQQMQERKENAKLRWSVNKDKIVELHDSINFRVHNFDKVVVHYAGSGDSGAIEDMDFYLNDKEVFSNFCGYSSDKEQISFPSDSKFDETEKAEIRGSKIVRNFITYLEDMVYDMLEERHGGWEINDGQEGTFTFTFKNNSMQINHDYTVFTYDSQQHQEEF